MDITSIANRDIIFVGSLREVEADANSYRMPALQKWAFVVEINAIMLQVFCALFVFMLHQKQFDPLLYRFADIIGIMLVGVLATILSFALDYAAVHIYRTAHGRSASLVQCGQILDWTSLFLLMTSLAVLGWAAACFVRTLGQWATLLAAMLA